MTKRKVLRLKADIQDLLLKASTLADNAVTSAKKKRAPGSHSDAGSSHPLPDLSPKQSLFSNRQTD
jgi:hypothetical protein